MKHDIFNESVINDVVEHMNDDHQDACLAIVHALSDHKTAVKATMLRMDSSGVDFAIVASTGEEKQVRVSFIKPITRASQIRGHLVALTKRARAALEQ